jgi:hypothetical protein
MRVTEIRNVLLLKFRAADQDRSAVRRECNALLSENSIGQPFPGGRVL